MAGQRSRPATANLFHIKVKERYCDPDKLRDREKQSLKLYATIILN